MGTNIAVAKVADRMGNWHVGRAAARSDGFAMQREPRKDKEVDPL